MKHGKYEIEDIFFAASNARSGTLYRFSCLTVNGEMKLTFHPAAPLVDEATNGQFADSLLELLETVAGTRDVPMSDSPLDALPEGLLVKATTLIGSAALLSHAPGYLSFFESVLQMKNSVEPADFWPALNFWIFFAVGHPILQPILWISDVLHASPGPMVAGLVPLTFIAGNAIAIAAVSFSNQVRSVMTCCFHTHFVV